MPTSSPVAPGFLLRGIATFQIDDPLVYLPVVAAGQRLILFIVLQCPAEISQVQVVQNPQVAVGERVIGVYLQGLAISLAGLFEVAALAMQNADMVVCSEYNN